MPKFKFVCPFCFEESKISDLEFRCVNRRCVDVDDVPMTVYENGDINNPKAGKTCFKVPMRSGNIPNGAKCPECNSITHRIVCPKCHNSLPESTINGEDMIISIVGARASGKSHFVGVIINELLNRIAVSFDGAMEGFDDTMKRYKAGSYQKLYVDLTKLDLTQSSETNINNDAYRPLIFTLKLREKSFFKTNIKSFTFVFFDTAGEDLEDMDLMNTVNKYICKSAGIIFLLDPMQIPAVVNGLDNDTVARASAAGNMVSSSDDIITRVSKMIRDDKKMADTKKIDIPVAAVFSKFDAIVPLIPEGSTVLDTSPHCSKKVFDMKDWRNVDVEIRSLLEEWGETAFTSQVDLNYSNYSYFTISALGLNNNPSVDSKILRPKPHRIEDPLLWILKEKGVIKAK